MRGLVEELDGEGGSRNEMAGEAVDVIRRGK